MKNKIMEPTKAKKIIDRTDKPIVNTSTKPG